MTTTPETRSILATAEPLVATLEQIGDALVALDLTALLGAEEKLADVLAAMPSAGPCDEGEREALAATVQRGRRALLRCRRLGGSFSSVVRARLPRILGQDTYTSSGYGNPPPAPPTVEATV